MFSARIAAILQKTPEEDTMDEIVAKLDEFIRERCEVGDDPEYGLDVDLFDMGFMDSMGAVETVMFAEETFGVEISQKDITLYPMNTVNEIAEVVGRKKGLC
ncbi:MAG TPA: acyl carrier protein [Candidatus Scatomorpha merdigallinarum]|nr:acyl carrier protein [Candidatus Scatomorpha merdigallinarum]